MSLNARVTLFAIAVLMCGPSFVCGQSLPEVRPVPNLDGAAQLMLIRNTLTLVNHGNLTGNYTVLRDLSTPQFRQRNSAADLAATFANLRQQKLDLSPVLVVQPQMTRPPEFMDGRMQLTGIFPTRPQAVQFSLAFAQIDGGWMIDEVSLRVAPAETRPPAATTKAPATKPPAAVENRPAPAYLPQPSEIRAADRDRTRSAPTTSR